MGNLDLITFKDPGKDLSSHGEAVSTVELAIQMFSDKCYSLPCLIIYAGKPCEFVKGETIHFDSDYVEPLLEH
ncbi:MAG: hypothetical protein MJZ12_06185 [Prevotella sp.]|nr:hypothetical protein [Prevotella sp.]